MSEKAIEILPPPLPFPSFRIEDAPKAQKGKRRRHDLKPDDMEIDNLELGELPILHEKTNGSVFPDRLAAQSSKETEESRKEIEAAIRKAKKGNIFSFFGKFLGRNAKSTKSELPKIATSAAINDISGAKMKIEECRKMLEAFDLSGAKQSYIELLGIYNCLSFDEKKMIYNDLNDIYMQRKSAESLKG